MSTYEQKNDWDNILHMEQTSLVNNKNLNNFSTAQKRDFKRLGHARGLDEKRAIWMKNERSG